MLVPNNKDSWDNFYEDDPLLMPAMPYVNTFFEYYKDHRVVIYLRNRGLNKIDFEDYAHYVL